MILSERIGNIIRFLSPTGRVSCNVKTVIDNLQNMGFVPYGACELQPGERSIYEKRKNVSSPTGRVSCNFINITNHRYENVSSPTGRVSCNKFFVRQHLLLWRFVPYGACELQQQTRSALICFLRVSSPTGRVSCNRQ